MEEFYKKREEDFNEYVSKFEKALEMGYLSTKEIFEHAYTLGALQNANAKESND